MQGKKDILGLWLNETESKNVWIQIFDEIKKRGVEEIFFISMDGVSGLADGAKSIFPNVIVQRCIVHLIRNSIKYVPSKDYKAFTAHLKKDGAPLLKAAKNKFEKFKQAWSMYPGAVDVWVRNFEYKAHLTKLTNLLCASSKGHYKREKAFEIRNAAIHSIGCVMLKIIINHWALFSYIFPYNAINVVVFF